MTEVIVIRSPQHEESIEPIQVNTYLSKWMDEIESIGISGALGIIEVDEDGPLDPNEWSMRFLWTGVGWIQLEGRQFFSDVPCDPIADTARIRNACRSRPKPVPSPMEIPF